MKLDEYFIETGVTKAFLSRRARVSLGTIENIIAGKDFYVSCGKKIVIATNGLVTLDEMSALVKID